MATTDQVKLNNILSLLQKIKFGSLTIVVHEGQITQLEVIEKHRFQK
nr:YezD family protein [uncultured Bacillus sp.]